MPVRRSNKRSYESTEVKSWLFVSLISPWKMHVEQTEAWRSQDLNGVWTRDIGATL